MPSATTIDLLARLVAHDTTSRNSNLPLIDEVEAYLNGLGVTCERVVDEAQGKAGLIASIGPHGVPGVILSGHTDTVPVDGEAWTSDPFTLTERDGRYYGRGACDMKGFLAACLSKVPEMLAAPLATPLHLVFSYDEEVGCTGVRPMIERIATWDAPPSACIVGEPTEMGVVLGHKGKYSLVATVTGRTGHSSRAPDYVNAVDYAIRLGAKIMEIAERLGTSGTRDLLYDIPYATAHIGVLKGGTALNIVPDHATIDFEFRPLVGDDGDALVEEVVAYARDVLEPQMKAKAPATGIVIDVLNTSPGLETPAEAEVTTMVKRLAGRNDHAKVAYATEAGLFQSMAAIPTVVCGPGSIAQAHQPDEFIAASELDRCEAFLDRLINQCRA